MVGIPYKFLFFKREQNQEMRPCAKSGGTKPALTFAKRTKPRIVSVICHQMEYS